MDMSSVAVPDEDKLSGLTIQRRDAVLEWMTSAEVDLLLLGTADNIRYATNYRSLPIHETGDHFICALSPDGGAVIFGPHVKESQKQPHPDLPHVLQIRPLSGWTPLMAEPETAINAISARIREVKPRRVGFDGFNAALVDGIREQFSEVDFRYVGQALFDIRRTKFTTEVQLMELASVENNTAIEAAFARAAEGSRDRDLLATVVLEHGLQRAELICHGTCSVRAEPWNWFASNKELQRGESIFIDQVYYGLGGYCSDIARTAFVDEPPVEVRRAYQRYYDAYEELVSRVRPGTSVDELDTAANNALRKLGLAESPYALGHGIGIRDMEPPSIGPTGLLDAPRKLRVGDVVAVEPESGVEVDGFNHPLKIEHCFLVTDDGARPIGPLPPREPTVITL